MEADARAGGFVKENTERNKVKIKTINMNYDQKAGIMYRLQTKIVYT